MPLLIQGMQAYYLFPGAEQMFNLAKSQDKDYIVIEGLTLVTSPWAGLQLVRSTHQTRGCIPMISSSGVR